MGERVSSGDDTVRIEICPLCACTGERSPDDAAALGLKRPFGILRCPACTFRWQSPRPNDQAFSQLYEVAYHDVGEEISLDWKRDYPAPPENLRRSSKGAAVYVKAQHRHYLDRLATLKPERGRLLEIGCSTGDFLIAAQADGWEVLGIEPSQAAVDQARERGLPVEQGTFEDHSPLIGVFDAVFLGHVFEHLDDPAGFSIDIQRNLRPDGALFLEVPNQFESLAAISRRWANRVRPRDVPSSIFSIHHVSFFSARTLSSVLSDAGLAQVEIRHWTPDGTTALRKAANRLGTALGRSGLLQATARKPS